MKKQGQSVGLLDDVRDEVLATRRGPPRWYERVSPEHRDELNAIRSAWKAGELGTRKKTLACSISANLRKRGISYVGHQGVATWLDED